MDSDGSNGALENYFYCQKAVASYKIIDQRSSFIITIVICSFSPSVMKLGINYTERLLAKWLASCRCLGEVCGEVRYADCECVCVCVCVCISSRNRAVMFSLYSVISKDNVKTICQSCSRTDLSHFPLAEAHAVLGSWVGCSWIGSLLKKVR